MAQVSASRPLPPSKPGGPELLLITFPPPRQLQEVWARDPKAFPHYVEIELSFLHQGQQHQQVVGVDLTDSHLPRLHKGASPPLVAELVADACQQGVFHLSVWVDGPPVLDAGITLLGYEQQRDLKRTDKGTYFLKMPLQNPPGMPGPVIYKLDTSNFGNSLSYIPVLRDAAADPVGLPNLRVVEEQWAGGVHVHQGQVRVVDLPLGGQVALTLRRDDERPLTVRAVAMDPDVATLGVSGHNDLLITGGTPGQTRVNLIMAGTAPASFSVTVAPAREGAAPAPALPRRYLTRVPPTGREPSSDGPHTLLVSSGQGEAWVSVFPTEGPSGLSVDTALTAGEQPFAVGVTTLGPVVATVAGVRLVARDRWLVRPDEPVHLMAATAHHLAVATDPYEAMVQPATVLVYRVMEAGPAVAAGTFVAEPFPQMMRWRGGEVWVAHRDGRVVQGVPGKNGFTRRLVQPEPRQVTPWDMAVAPDGSVLMVGDGRLDVFRGEGAAARLVATHPLPCAAQRIVPAGGNGFVVGCAGVRRTGQEHGVYNYAMAPGAHLLRVTLEDGQVRTSPIHFGKPPGLFFLLTPWPGGFLVGLSGDDSQQKADQVNPPPRRGTVRVVRPDGSVAATAPTPPPVLDFGVAPVPWRGGVYAVFQEKTVMRIAPR